MKISLAVLVLISGMSSAHAMPCVDITGNNGNLNIHNDSKGTIVKLEGKRYEVTDTEDQGEGTENVTLQNTAESKDKIVLSCQYNAEG